MNRKKTLVLALALTIAGILVLNVLGVPSRVPRDEQERRDSVRLRLEQIHADTAVDESIDAIVDEVVEEAVAEVTATVEEASSEEPETEKEDDMWPETAPDVFKVKFECTNGEFIVECHKDWAPLGVERFYQLVREGFYNDAGFFRVVPGFVVQFGLAADPEVTAKWRTNTIKDDPVKETNAPGTVTFATSGPNSRTTQIFINLGNNAGLDQQGFSPFGKVIEGMDVVNGITSEYGQQPQQPMIVREGNSYLRKNFPNMDYIVTASLVQ